MNVKDVMEIIERDGWFMVRIKGSHRQYRHSYKKGLVTIAGHLNDDLAKGTLNSIFKQAGLKYGREKGV
jgi:predicted RNA binding protein YcfA (HicA-like mRNA interferase family)